MRFCNLAAMSHVRVSSTPEYVADTDGTGMPTGLLEAIRIPRNTPKKDGIYQSINIESHMVKYKRHHNGENTLSTFSW